MMHYSKSETTRELFDKDVERELYDNFLALYFQNLLENGLDENVKSALQANYLEFLEKSAANTNWLSQCNLNNLNKGLMEFQRTRIVEKADIGVQCHADEIERETCGGWNSQRSLISATSSGVNSYCKQRIPSRNRFPNGPEKYASSYFALNASINTQTTDTQTSEMDFYRRASYLELYGMEKAKEMDEMEHQFEQIKQNSRKKKTLRQKLFSCFGCRRKVKRELNLQKEICKNNNFTVELGYEDEGSTKSKLTNDVTNTEPSSSSKSNHDFLSSTKYSMENSTKSYPTASTFSQLPIQAIVKKLTISSCPHSSLSISGTRSDHQQKNRTQIRNSFWSNHSESDEQAVERYGKPEEFEGKTMIYLGGYDEDNYCQISEKKRAQNNREINISQTTV